MNKVIKSIYLTALAFNYASHAMESTIPWQPWQISWKQAVCAPANAFTKLPDKLAMLDNSSPITDEMLLTHNPDWHYVQGFDQETKNAILSNILEYPKAHNYGHDWPSMRSAIALITCLGAHPDASSQDTALIWSTDEQDFPLTKFLLEKGANPNAKTSYHRFAGPTPLKIVNNLALTKLLVEYGAIIDPKMLQHCCFVFYPSEVMHYYVTKNLPADRRAQYDNGDSRSLTLLHHLASNNMLAETTYIGDLRRLQPETQYNQAEKACILLQAGFNPARQDKKGNTPLHFIAYRESGGLCAALLTHYPIHLRKPFLEFLLCMNRTHPKLKLPKDVRKLIFQQFVCESMRTFLDIKNCKGETAHDIWNRGLEIHKGTMEYYKKENSKKTAEEYAQIYEHHKAMVELINPNTFATSKIAQAQEELEKAKFKALQEEATQPKVTRSSAGLHLPHDEDQWGC